MTPRDDSEQASAWSREARALREQFAAFLATRVELAKIEVQVAIRQSIRFAIWIAIVLVMLLTALPLWLVAAADLLAEWTPLARVTWLAVFALGLMLAAAAVGRWAWATFRRQFVGLEESIGELREDVLWLQEWLGPTESDDSTENPSEATGSDATG